MPDHRKDIANQEMDWYWPDGVDLPGYKPTTKGHAKQVKDARSWCDLFQRDEGLVSVQRAIIDDQDVMIGSHAASRFQVGEMSTEASAGN